MATPTPVRHLPGAFINTPAPANDPTRRNLFGDAAAGAPRVGPLGRDPLRPAPDPFRAPGAPGPPQPSGPPAQPGLQLRPDHAAQPPVLRAAKVVNDLLQLDERYPDLNSLCSLRTSSEYDLETLDPAFAPFHKPTMYPIPDRVFENFDRGQIATSMGLFTEINHAWVTIDNALYLWDYTNPDPELIGYEESPHTITTLALVRPKGDVFVNTITHILVLATATDIILLGVSATPTPSGSHTVSLYSTRMTLHKGSLDVSYIVGSADGRIFFGGNNDTDVHELYYQQEEKWFSSRCGKINHTHPGWSSVVPKLPHPSTLLPSPSSLWTPKANEALADMVIDDSRKLLYTLSNTSTIRVYQMEGLYKLNKCIEKDRTTCFNETTHFVSGSPLLTTDMTIVSISPISAVESFNIHLVALTSTGCRIFLSATSTSSASGSAPQSMQVIFVKFPPSPDQVAQEQQAGDGAYLNVNSQALTTSRFGQRFAPGYFFDFVAKADNPNTDILFVAAPGTGRIKLQHSTVARNESALRYFESANFVDLGQGVKVLAIGSITPPFAAAGQPVGFGNELAVQFDQDPSEFAIMTNMGIHIIRRRRMVDIFATVIRKAASEDTVKFETIRFIQHYGRNETVSTALAIACGQGNDLRNGAARVIDQVTQDRARSVFIDFGGDPTVTETDSINLSARHHALGLYLTRLVRMLWKSRVIHQGLDAAGAVSVRSTVPLTKLNSVQENLDRLRNFLETNRGVIKGLNGPQDLASAQNRLAEIAMQSEHQGLHSLQRLMENIAEGISFVLMLFDERVAEIFVRLDAPTQNALRGLTYEQLFSQDAGRDLAKLLVKAIVNRNIESGANVETVADALRRRCGSFCSPDDVVVFKAQEQLKRASEQAGNPNHLRQLLGESLRLFERVARSLTLANLHGAVQQYLELQYYAGAIQLCLRVAQEKDRGNTALSWINDGRPPNDARQAAFNERRSCYDLVHEVMQRLDAASAREPEVVDGRPTLAATKRNEAYNVVNGSDDEVFHFDLYEWYIEQNWTDRILAIDSPHVITFLQRLASTEAQHADLLCRFYTLRGRFYEAAEVQADLAKNEVLEIGIKDRITLLSRAKGNASVSTVGISRQHQQVLNHDVTTLLEIAHIQDDLLERLKADERIPADRKVDCEQALNGPILSLTELFNGFAEPANYYDLSLLIYHAADHHAPRLIADTWRSLITAAHNETEEAYRTWQEREQEREQERQDRQDRGRPNNDAEVGPPALPYEHVVNKVQDIAHRTSMNNHVFPIDTVLTILCEYVISQRQNEEIQADPTWPVLLFVNNLGVAHAIVARVLERILDAQEAPFINRHRKLVVRWILVACELWVREVERRGLDGQQGGGNIGRWTVQLLSRAAQAMQELAAAEREINRPEHAMEAQALMVGARDLAEKIKQVLGLEEGRAGRGGL